MHTTANQQLHRQIRAAQRPQPGRSGLRKIAEPQRGCEDVNHDPPNMISLKPGTYTHKCPACGVERVITVPERRL